MGIYGAFQLVMGAPQNGMNHHSSTTTAPPSHVRPAAAADAVHEAQRREAAGVGEGHGHLTVATGDSRRTDGTGGSIQKLGSPGPKWGFPKLGVPNGWFIWENPIEVDDDLGGSPMTQDTSKSVFFQISFCREYLLQF